MLRQRGRVGLMAAALVVLAVGGAQAAVTTERSASILVFPKVISNGTRDTIIQITNTGNSMVHAHCFYVNGAPTRLDFPACHNVPPGLCLNPPRWTEVDFDIWLTAQQPTHWDVRLGRLVDPLDQRCTNGSTNPPIPPFFGCNGAGLDPGLVPPTVEFFTGELKCIEVAADGTPVSGNHLKGEATLVTLDTCNFLGDEVLHIEPLTCQLSGLGCTSDADCHETFDVAKYNAIGIPGNENNNGDNVLCLGGQVSDQCPNGAEYDACPAFYIANHFSEGAPEPLVEEFGTNPEASSSVNTAFTIVPCTENFEEQTPETVLININTFNEFETAFSSQAIVTCWDELFLSQINPTAFLFTSLGTSFAQSRLRISQQTNSAFLMIGEEFHSVNVDVVGEPPSTAVAAVNHFVEGEHAAGDLITIPPDQVGGGAGSAQ
jgi:hypothetical protein